MMENVSKDMLFSMIRTEVRLAAEKKAAGDAVTAHRRRVKALTGVETKNFLKTVETFTNGADEFVDDLAELQRLMQRLDLPVGFRFDVLDELAAKRRQKKAHEESEEPIATNYFQAGVQAALKGIDPKECPHGPETKAYQEWAQGFNFAEEHAKKGDKLIEELQASDEDDMEDDADEDDADLEDEDDEDGDDDFDDDDGDGDFEDDEQPPTTH